MQQDLTLMIKRSNTITNTVYKEMKNFKGLKDLLKTNQVER